MLRFQRDTLALKCAGLTADQLRTRAISPRVSPCSAWSGHAAEVERGWFRDVVNGERGRSPWTPPGSTDRADFDVDGADADGAFAVWREECARARAIVAAAPPLDVTTSHGGETYSLRCVITHMIEEYARHNGHADLLRERIDGTTGE
ncbi:DinB family protein [Streptomyces roseicoloratus]|uniref:DinB family protein n=1 Tax=Streptomyces roseicoloratus TaxID=2508722 RepID=A0ABY9S238_9ACTN|nr:DinB family protein [Streptomyces roseicoloratus]WMX48502.1 DinB family protein [Streptomyces roseicoloratus]